MGDFTLNFDISCYFNKLCHLHMSIMNLRQRKAYVIYNKALFVGVDNIESLGSGHPISYQNCEEARYEVTWFPVRNGRRFHSANCQKWSLILVVVEKIIFR